MTNIFEDRFDAGRRLAKKLVKFTGPNTIVLAVPKGGIPLAAVADKKFQISWHVIVTAKLPIPWNPESGFGAVAADGSVVLNNSIVEGLELTTDEIQQVVDEVRKQLNKRVAEYSSIRKPIEVVGKDVILIDDGIASGYTMLAAIESLRSQNASRVIVSAPVASRSAAQLIEKNADDMVIEIISPAIPFAVADFYLDWHDLSDEDISILLKEL